MLIEAVGLMTVFGAERKPALEIGCFRFCPKPTHTAAPAIGRVGWTAGFPDLPKLRRGCADGSKTAIDRLTADTLALRLFQRDKSRLGRDVELSGRT